MTRLASLLLAAALAAAPARPAEIRNGYLKLEVRGSAVTRLQADPTGRGRASLEFVRELRPVGWLETPETRVERRKSGLTLAPLRIWSDRAIDVRAEGEGPYAALLEPGRTLAQTFTVPPGAVFTTVSILIPTWHTSTSGATLSLYRGGTRIATRRLRSVPDNSWQTLTPSQPQGEGQYRVELSEPEGQIGWWSLSREAYPNGGAQADGQPVPGDRTLRVDLRVPVGTGTLELTLAGRTLDLQASARCPQEPLPAALSWIWRTSWTQLGYDCTPKAGVLFSRFFTDNQRYMAVQQLKRRTTAGLSFDGARWIEMEGNRDADLRLEGSNLHLHWDMAPSEMTLGLRSGVQSTGPGQWRSRLRISALPRRDSVPPSFPRFVLPSAQLQEDVNRLWWERAFSYPAPAGPGAWLEWMALMRSWYAGPQRDGEMEQLRGYPITSEGYVHTWGQTVGWPFPASPPYDTRHFDTNARFILACWRFYLWTGDVGFLRSQQQRLRRAMRYQLETLGGKSGLIRTVSKDVNGRHKGVGNNYWDILPFGHLDAYANAVFHESLTAMEQIDRVLGSQPLADYAALRRLAHRRFDEVFWDEAKGRYIGCVDVDGKRHDYGFTFVNLEALYYGLGDAGKAARVYRWMETGVSSTGKADIYSRWVFAPRATTIHNPMWAEDAPESERKSPLPPWWHFGWMGTPFGDQCQDGGAILYTSYFDLMDRLRYRGPEDAWRRFEAILARYRLPDRLCGGPPLFRGEIPQQENPGQVGTDLPFPESGLVPCFLLYGVMGLEATPEGLRVKPSLPASLPWMEVQGLSWRGAELRVRVAPRRVWISGQRGGRSFVRGYRLTPGRALLLTPRDLWERAAPAAGQRAAPRAGRAGSSRQSAAPAGRRPARRP